ncbi:CDP-diacylglycerol--glycerol-3-phosphate 3-phosphatidyltransferase [Pseudonocardia sp. HH130630-07]|uniref:CDP-diacylglycerol--glycerol-3-phosphate 3-phosphatidyltransferase n=1 Tax=Pseudonocardia sp. HH130630-07 TaxID=1690815 RepID=UPI000814E6A7|nr:CDP-diacylglycerol--glycerol-3-phosphate 3-phosphatidyltransferase [Pseudonocardia sp. HH130630-07]ANY08401.1 CDP-diacylglycerol--glycerol-3-phosphate 3-phosphatidyltransferase [Pseudonocardia sp. HH130630-07]
MSSSQPAGDTVPVGGEAPLLNIANALTCLRLLLVPVFVVALFTGGGEDTVWRLIAFAIFVVAALTDRLDGQLARSRGLVTWFGALVDPIADKALTGAALIGLSLLGLLPWWVTIVIVVRELGITVLRFVVIRRGVIPASRGGKAKTVAQTVAISLFLFPLPLLLPDLLVAVLVLQWAVMAVALVLTVLTGADYVRKAVRPQAS